MAGVQGMVATALSAIREERGETGPGNESEDDLYDLTVRTFTPRRPKEQEGQLVALIPLKDDRLKPRRTKLYVGLSVFVCLTAAGLLLFFMFPRNVTMTSNKPFLLPQNLSINTDKEVVKFNITNHVNFTNSNYFAVTVKKLQMDTIFRTKVLSSSVNNKKNNIGLRDDSTEDISASIKFSNDNELGYMAKLCNDSYTYFHEFDMVFMFTATYSYLGHEEQTSLTTFQTVSCGKITPGPPISTLPPFT